MHEIVNPREREEKIEVRWGLREDEARIEELLEFNGMRRDLPLRSGSSSRERR